MNLMQTLNFLFIPEAILSVVFLVIFFILFGFGIWLYIRCKDRLIELNRNAESMYEKVSNKISPETFLRAEIDKSSANEGVLEGIPDAFVSIGILATFIGLGVAIQGAADLLQTDTFELEKLIDLLGIIAFKFQTSVWGILFSLIFKRFIVEQYFYYKQEIIDKVRERLYAKERDGIRLLLEKQNDFLEKQFDYQKEIDISRKEQAERKYNEYSALFESKINEMINAQNANYRDLVMRQNEQHDKLIEQNAQLHKENIALQANMHKQQLEHFSNIHAEQTAQQAEKQKALINQLTTMQQTVIDSDNQTQQILNEQLGVERMIHDELPTYINASVKFTETAEQFEKDTLTFSDYVENYRKTVEETFDKLTNAHKELSEKQYDTLLVTKQTVEDIQKIYVRSEEQYKQHIDDVQNAFLLKEDEYVREMRSKLDNMFRITGETFRNSITKISEDYNSIFRTTIENFKETLDNNITKVSEDYNKVLQTFNDNFNASIKKVNSDYTKEVQHFGEVSNNLSKVITGIDTNVKVMHDELLNEQKNIIAMNQAAFNKVGSVINGFNTAAQQQIANMTAIYTQMNTLLKNMESINNKALQNQNEIFSKFITEFANTLKVMHNLSKAVSAEQIQTNNNMRSFQQDTLQKYSALVENINQTLTGSFSKMNDSLNILNKSVVDSQKELIESISNNNDLLLILQNNINETLKQLMAQQKESSSAFKSILLNVYKNKQPAQNPQNQIQPQVYLERSPLKINTKIDLKKTTDKNEAGVKK